MPGLSSSDPTTSELVEKTKSLEEEAQRLTAENIELRQDIAEKIMKSVRPLLTLYIGAHRGYRAGIERIRDLARPG